VIRKNTTYDLFTVVAVHESGETTRVHKFTVVAVHESGETTPVHKFILYVKLHFSDMALLSTM